VQRRRYHGWALRGWSYIHILGEGMGFYHWRAFGFHTERSRKCWVSSGMHKREKDKKKIGVGGKEEEGCGERAALKTRSIVGCVCLGS
jgi:hypothetical protein